MAEKECINIRQNICSLHQKKSYIDMGCKETLANPTSHFLLSSFYFFHSPVYPPLSRSPFFSLCLSFSSHLRRREADEVITSNAFLSLLGNKNRENIEMMNWWWARSAAAVLCLLLQLVVNQANGLSKASCGCDFFRGRWVKDDSYPLYNNCTCPFVEREFNCLRNGRKDQLYLHFRWQPQDCDLARFNGQDFLTKLRGKSIMFVGDSLSLNQWESLTCLLYSMVPNVRYNITRQDYVSTFTFMDYGLKVMVDRNVFLVDVVRENIGRVLKLDSIEGGKLWRGMDMLIFNTWHWWNRRGPTQPWDYIEEGNQTSKDMDRLVAFEKALGTWGKWVDDNIEPSKTMVFFQGISPSHYNGSEWNEPHAKSCLGQTQPLLGSTYPAGLPPAVAVLKRALSKITKPVMLLDVTLLSLLRKEGHPSIYGQFGMDCSHWCLPGVPDTWNEILYNHILLTVDPLKTHK